MVYVFHSLFNIYTHNFNVPNDNQTAKAIVFARLLNFSIVLCHISTSPFARKQYANFPCNFTHTRTFYYKMYDTKILNWHTYIKIDHIGWSVGRAFEKHRSIKWKIQNNNNNNNNIGSQHFFLLLFQHMEMKLYLQMIWHNNESNENHTYNQVHTHTHYHQQKHQQHDISA